MHVLHVVFVGQNNVLWKRVTKSNKEEKEKKILEMGEKATWVVNASMKFKQTLVSFVSGRAMSRGSTKKWKRKKSAHGIPVGHHVNDAFGLGQMRWHVIGGQVGGLVAVVVVCGHHVVNLSHLTQQPQSTEKKEKKKAKQENRRETEELKKR